MATANSTVELVALEDLLLDCLQADRDKSQGNRLASLNDAGAIAFAELAQHHKVTPLLYHKLLSRGLGERSPAVLMDRLKTAHSATLARNMRLYAEFRRLARALQTEGINLIVLKGLFLGEAVYGNVAVRPMADIDLLVAGNDVEQANNAVMRLGYEPEPMPGVYFPARESKHLPRLNHRDSGVPLEIHRAICDSHETYSIATGDLFARAVATKLAGVPILRLSTEDLLLHLCTHASYQDEFKVGLRPLCDIAEVLRRYDNELDWVVLVDRATEWRVSKGAYACLLTVRNLLGANVPDETLLALEPRHEVSGLAKLVRDRIFITGSAEQVTRPTPEFANMVSRTGFRQKYQAFVQRAMLDRVSLASANNISPTSPWMFTCYLNRWRYLLKQYGPIAVKLIRGDGPSAHNIRLIAGVHRWLTGED